MIRFEQPEIFTVLTTPDHVDAVADHANVSVSVFGGEYVAFVPFPLGVLRYSAPVPADEFDQALSETRTDYREALDRLGGVV